MHACRSTLEDPTLPAYPAIKIPGTFISLFAEVGLALWLLVRGVKDDRPAGTPLTSVGTQAASTR